MQLLVAIINDPEKLDEVLSGFIELGITGATILSSEGMGALLSHDIPIFAGLKTLINRSRPQNRTILSVIEDDRVEPAMALLQEVCGDLSVPATGIAFTISLGLVVGLAPELGDDQDEL